MITLLLQLLRFLPFLCGGHRQLALENLALHQQLAVYKRTAPRPKLRTTDRLFWVALARVWAGWRQPLVIVTPDTILRWQRRRFREHWTKLSGRPPSITSAIWSPSISSPFLPRACASCSSSSCSLTTAGASSTSTLPSIPALLGRPSRSWTPSPTIPPRPISSAIATQSTATPS